MRWCARAAHAMSPNHMVCCSHGGGLERNPAALDELNHSYSGKASIALSNALMDWRDQWGAR